VAVLSAELGNEKVCSTCYGPWGFRDMLIFSPYQSFEDHRTPDLRLAVADEVEHGPTYPVPRAGLIRSQSRYWPIPRFQSRVALELKIPIQPPGAYGSTKMRQTGLTMLLDCGTWSKRSKDTNRKGSRREILLITDHWSFSPVVTDNTQVKLTWHSGKPLSLHEARRQCGKVSAEVGHSGLQC